MYNYSGSGFVMFLFGIGFFVGLTITLLIVYLIIRLVEQYLWPRGKAFTRPTTRGAGAAAPAAPQPAAASKPAAPEATGPEQPDATDSPAAPESRPATVAPGHEEGETTRAIRILDLRLANGEIEIDDYKSRRDALGRPYPEE